jgi:hypothetical protein
MARIPILRFGSLAGQARQFHLTAYRASISLQGLLRGVDNLRHDVHLSPRFCDAARHHVARRIAHHAGIADLLKTPPSSRRLLGSAHAAEGEDKGNPAEFQRLLTELLLEALARAKARECLSVDLLARLAALKFLRLELAAQFTEVLERCRASEQKAESLRLSSAVGIRERVGAMLVGKRRVLRRNGQELFEVMREIEKQHLSRMRRSLFGDTENPSYELFLNRLLYTEDGRDDYLNAEHYVMLGNRETDADRFAVMRQIACSFLLSLELAGEDEAALDGVLSAPENAQELVAAGTPDAYSSRGKSQRAILQRWLEMLESAGVMNYVVAAYEVVPLLTEYSPIVNAQQLKNALISREERARVEKLIEEHGRLSPASLNSAVRRVGALRAGERAKMAGRFLADFMRYHRDLRRMEALHAALDSVHLVSDERVRQMSALNGMLYEFVLAEEHKPAEEKIVRHVIIKADIRDSTRLTRALSERGLNPASHFSLNFYNPVNKLLAAYNATKVFLEGDAIILALLEREGESGFVVSRACLLAREIHDVVRAYNDQSRGAGLPALELGIGIAYQESSPMYLMDGDTRIMISDALNESDRLSSCSRIARRILPLGGPFSVYLFQMSGGEAFNGIDDGPALYNVGGIQLSAAAFARLQQEISLQEQEARLPRLWDNEHARLYTGLAPLPGGSFHRLVVREGRIPAINVRDLSLADWTNLFYYEVCTNAAVYDCVQPKSSAAAGGQSKG